MPISHEGRTARYETNVPTADADGHLLSIRFHGNAFGGAVVWLPSLHKQAGLVLSKEDRLHLIELLKSFDEDKSDD